MPKEEETQEMEFVNVERINSIVNCRDEDKSTLKSNKCGKF